MQKLEILIPTFNRTERLIELLHQLRNVTALPITVSDNCSMPKSVQLSEICDGLGVKYIRQSKNIGMAGNFKYLIDNCSAEYYLLLGDDDFINSQFSRLEKYNFSADLYIIQHTVARRGMQTKAFRSFSLKEISRFIPLIHVRPRYVLQLMFLSAHIGKTTITRNIIKNISKNSLPLDLTLKYLSCGRKIRFINEPIIQNTWGEESWSTLRDDIFKREIPDAFQTNLSGKNRFSILVLFIYFKIIFRIF